MDCTSDHPGPLAPAEPPRRPRLGRLWQALLAVAAALVLYALWRGYQNPDLILDIAVTFGLC